MLPSTSRVVKAVSLPRLAGSFVRVQKSRFKTCVVGLPNEKWTLADNEARELWGS